MVELHLSKMDAARISDCQARWRRHPHLLLQIENFLPGSIADKVSGLLQSHAEFGSVYGLHDKPSHIVDRQEWLNADEDNRFFHYEMLTGMIGSNHGKEMLAFLKLRQFLSSGEFCNFVGQITDEDIASVTKARVHRLRDSHFLRSHHDRLGARKIAYILYLSPDWKPEYGGQLTLIGRDDSSQRLEPTYNSLVLFDVTLNQEHYIEALTSRSKGRPRDTMSGWFLSGEKS